MSDLEREIRQRGERIFNALEDDSGSIFNKDWWYGRIMDWSMKNDQFKTQMFRFVDVLPYLQSSSEVAKHLKEYFAEGGDDLPSVFNFGLGLGSLAPGLLAGAVKKNVTQMAKMFITGESPKEALSMLKKARERRLTFTADLLGEATLSEKEAVEYQRRYIELIDLLSDDALNWATIPQIDEDENGPIPKVNVSVKVTSVFSQIDEAAWDLSKEKVKERLRPILDRALERGVFINLDQEQYAHKDFILDVFIELINEDRYSRYPHFGIVQQAYLRDSLADAKRLCEAAARRKVPFTVRLVKGAYWDYETLQARQKGWPTPVYMNKSESDASYEDCAQIFLNAYPKIRLAVGSHNVRSISAALSYAASKRIDPRATEVQMLFGMADPIKRALIKDGIRVREYATIGELIPGMAYLVRRLLENTSNESFLRSKFVDQASTDTLLRDPRERANGPEPTNVDRFENEPPLDFGVPKFRGELTEALTRVRRDFGKTFPIIIGKKEVKTERVLVRENPSQPTEIIGRVCVAGPKEAELAIETAREGFETWRRVPALDRANMLEKMADLIESDKFRLVALEILEVGKTWREADGDVGEAVDFCRYYARAMRELSSPHKLGHTPGEASYLTYSPRGVTAVIAPWNFPLAILTGMVAASLVTGNTVVMKPAEQSSIIAYELYRVAMEAGVPAAALQFLPGYGEEIGSFLTQHKDVHMVAFTGSKEVGLSILRDAAIVQPGQRHVRRVIAEMGGKNAVIVDTDADLDEAVLGVMHSAFGFQGQKCSACSRAIVLAPVYDRFLERLLESTRSLRVGIAESPSTYLGPVVDAESKNRIMAAIEAARASGARLVLGGPNEMAGHFVSPTIFADVDPASDLAQKEIFGPVLAVIRAQDLDDALKIANSTEFALTGAFYSRSPANIERVRTDFDVGNLYINRGCTGAMVDRHPFGGHRLSGAGSKTGGPGYLEQFMEARVVTENTVRRGFAPAD